MKKILRRHTANLRLRFDAFLTNLFVVRQPTYVPVKVQSRRIGY